MTGYVLSSGRRIPLNETGIGRGERRPQAVTPFVGHAGRDGGAQERRITPAYTWTSPYLSER